MKKSFLLSFIIIFFFTISCEEDIFDRKPLDKISEVDVWTNEALLRAYLTDLYSRLPYGLAAQHLDTKTDIATVANGNSNAITTGGMSRTNDAISFWDYSIIRAINIFIEKIETLPDNSKISEKVQEQMLGEALVLRAMMYFELQRRYGGVPLVDVPLDPFNLPIDEKYTKRSTEADVADFIDNDLTRAIPLLTDDPSMLGRINKWTAYALKARANLLAASIAKYGNVQLNGLVGIPANRANEFYTKASGAANEVILSKKYTLFNQFTDKAENYQKLFITKKNGEAIFSKLYDGTTLYNYYNVNNVPQTISGRWGSVDNPLYDYVLASENIDGSPEQPNIGPDYLYDYASQAFEDKDPRVRASIVFDGEVIAGYTIRSYEGIDPSDNPDPNAILSTYGQTYQGMPQVAENSRLMPFTDRATNSGFMVKKFLLDVAFQDFTDCPWMEFRLGEMYLTRAEAEFELGNMQAAADALNATRERAGISLVNAGSITLNHVRTERMSELALEKHRWWDLRRWRIAEEVLNNRRMQGLRTILHFNSGKIYYLPVNAESFSRSFRPEHYYNPITDSRIDNNTNLVENPGY